ncbi:dual specificity protein phosphatase family protein [Uliginosibacterium gangwonense]|uniref:dual specificity protein phosphatase family protein n=1 Tax=Uliginosibacterium gangwonense TaxID=392736 RepID=UPI000377316D|nr:dual specificity protein phosphatase family protein [Uliginosibacterium gangwonense]
MVSSLSLFVGRAGRIFAICLLAAASLCVQAAEPVRKPEWATPIATTQNLYQVTPSFYRSAKLSTESLATLHKLGIRTVVSLRAFHTDNEVLDKSGIRMVRIPIYTWDIDDKDVIAALRAIHQAEAEGPVLLHCLHGADRTGLVTAMYRIVYQGWSREQALDELEHGGYGYHAIWKNIPKYLKNVDVERIRQAVQASDESDIQATH